MVSIGLVLGAGGVGGGAFHAGALAAAGRRHRLGSAHGRPHRRDLGRGAHGGVAAGGLSAADHLARATDQPLSPEGRGAGGHRPGAAPPGRAVTRPRRTALGATCPQAPWLLGPAFLPAGRRPLRAWPWPGCCPPGALPTAPLGERRAGLHDRPLARAADLDRGLPHR